MKKAFLLPVFFFFSFAYCQQDSFVKPDYKSIEKNVKDKDSPYFFKTLFKKYEAADSTMTLEEKRHLYYGYSFQDAYSPYGHSDAEEELQKILKKDDAGIDDLKEVIRLTDTIQKQYPFSLTIKNYRIYCFKELGKPEEVQKEYIQAGAIIDAIVSTGDGTTPEKSFYVINVKNEYEIIDILGFQYSGEQSLVDMKYDYLTLENNSYGVKGFYFDVSRCLTSMKF